MVVVLQMALAASAAERLASPKLRKPVLDNRELGELTSFLFPTLLPARGSRVALSH